MSSLLFVYLVIVLAFVFDFTNGLHDASNSVAALIHTGILKPWLAVLWAAFFNFIAFLFFHLHVAQTIGGSLVDSSIVDSYFIMSALIGAITFNLITTYLGLPSSSSHALIGGLVGATLASSGMAGLKIMGLSKTLLAFLISPVVGFLIAWLLLTWLLKKVTHPYSEATNRKSRWFQLFASAMLSLGHGGNDAQKTMGIIAVLLFSQGLLSGDFYVPLWLVISCNFVMGLGTLVGGQRIIRTLGKRITPLDPLGGACSSMGSAVALFAATQYGLPISTTHTVTGTVAGVGYAERKTNWPILYRILWGWVLTIPSAALIAALVVQFKPLFI